MKSVIERGHILGEKIGKEQVLIFLHIPKAGGSTLHSILEKEYQGVEHFFSVGPDDVNRFKALSAEEKEKIGVVRGHMNYGIHELLGKPSIYITMLRDPIERVISLYYYVKRDTNHFLHKEYDIKKMSLKDFIFTTTENDNGQTRACAGMSDLYPFFTAGQSPIPFGECSNRVLEMAKRNLQRFAVVGLTEKFDETLILLKKNLGWKKLPSYLIQNITPDRPRIKDIPNEVVKLIEKYNELDIELYRHVAIQLKEQLEQQGTLYKCELIWKRSWGRLRKSFC